ncbi:aspartate carbamoyltransferase catalytic subunit [Athalassotoga saccharophila]|uniref:aspartate carbamoyltransferase catalytic subunit n=1 Tax=Athalassotoga saccharophila TaxID=1441386 RepID=UPI00137A0256|nr:aspartate carbamoyltransferase catalytic subunit [Athalassotoga saccharophila]BBJ27331.1 aspartate carbamoyltransferase [Athalassotoga saccharophila]
MSIRGKDLFDVDDLEISDVKEIFERAQFFKKHGFQKLTSLKGKSICTLFFESSTRTRISFELAAKRLGADVVNFTASTSSLNKGESFKDTVKTLDAMGIDLYVIRHSEPGSPMMMKKYTNSPVINAGDGIHAHPTQALLDAYTIWEKFGDFKIKIAIIGDILHSRVARSNAKLLKMLGADVTLVGPESFIPEYFENYGVRISHDVEKSISESDAVMGLRVQLERQSGGFFSTLDEYNEFYGINSKRMEIANPIFMHPGPMNRGVEVMEEVSDSDSSVVEEQVTNGVFVRMALLDLILGGVEN